MVHIPYRRCYRRRNSLSPPVRPSHFITIVNIFAAVRLVFYSCQFNIVWFDGGYVRACHSSLSRFFFVFVLVYFVVTRLVTNGRFSTLSISQIFCHGKSIPLSQALLNSHFITHRSYILLQLRLLLQLLILVSIFFNRLGVSSWRLQAGKTT